MFDHGYATRIFVAAMSILIVLGLINASVTLRHEPCVEATGPMSQSERYHTVRNCLSQTDNPDALRLGFRTAMAGDVWLWRESVHHSRDFVVSWAVPALQHPDAERLIDEAAVGAEDYAALIHRKRSRYFSDDYVVAGRRSRIHSYRKIVARDDFSTVQQVDMRWLLLFLFGGALWFGWRNRSGLGGMQFGR